MNSSSQLENYVEKEHFSVCNSVYKCEYIG